MTNPLDDIRWKILRYFYGRNETATSRRGKRGSAVKISDVKRELKEQHNLSQTQVVSNLNYLLDSGWVKEEQVERTFATGTGTRSSPQVFYEITAAGMRMVEGASAFEPPDRYAGIKIETLNASGQNVIAMGAGNYVNVHYGDASSALGDLSQAIGESNELSEEQKLDYIADVQSAADQLAKAQPDRSIISSAWGRLQELGTIAALAPVVTKVASVIGPLLL